MASLNFARLARLPLALLLVALSTTFLFSHERGQFYRAGHHDYVSSEHLTVASNLSPDHGFLQFWRRVPVAEGEVHYQPYNSFPIGGYLLIKLATLPFDGLAAQIHAARALMLLFSAAAALLAFDAARRLTGNPWIALAATLFAFASPYCLYYNDMIAPETLAFFGVALTFHGMTIFALKGRFAQLAAKACAALLLGWYPFALLLPFVALGVLRGVLGERGRWPERLRGVARGPHLRLGVVAVLFGLAMVTLSLVNDRRAYGDDRPLGSLPTVESMRERFGLSDDFNNKHTEWIGLPDAVERSLHRIGRMAAPFALPGYAQNLGDFPIIGDAPDESPAARVAGFVVLAGVLVGLLFVRRHWVPLAAAALCGLAWELLMRHAAAFHDFVAKLFVGLCALFFALALCGARRLGGERLMPAAALFAFACFVQSSWSMGGVGADAEASGRERLLLADFKVIRKVTRGAAVSVDRQLALGSMALEYYLHGSPVMLWPNDRHDLADFTVTAHRLDIPGALTPGNSVAFLYDAGQLADFVQGLADGGRQVVEHADFDVYLHAGERVLVYVAGDAAPADEMHVLLLVSPTDAALLTAERRAIGSNWLNFDFRGFIHLEGRQRAQLVFLPDYPIRWIDTGRVADKVERWRQGFQP